MKNVLNKQTLLLAAGIVGGIVGGNLLAPHVSKIPVVGEYPEAVGISMITGATFGKKYLPKEVQQIVFTAGVANLVQTLVCRFS